MWKVTFETSFTRCRLVCRTSRFGGGELAKLLFIIRDIKKTRIFDRERARTTARGRFQDVLISKRQSFPSAAEVQRGRRREEENFGRRTTVDVKHRHSRFFFCRLRLGHLWCAGGGRGIFGAVVDGWMVP